MKSEVKEISHDLIVNAIAQMLQQFSLVKNSEDIDDINFRSDPNEFTCKIEITFKEEMKIIPL